MRRRVFIAVFALLGLGLSTSLWAAESSCNEAFKRVLYSDADYVANIQNAFQRELQGQKDRIESSLKSAAVEARKNCKDTQCVEETLIKASQVEELTQKACPINPKKNSGPMIQQIRNLAIGLSALGMAHTGNVMASLEAGEEVPDFPFDITATVITHSLWRTWIMCKNEYSAQNQNLSWARKTWKNFVAYQNAILFGNFVYMGYVAGEDWMRGEDVLSEEKLKGYGKEFVVSYVWDQAFAGIGVVAMDPLMKRLPDLAPSLAGKLGNLLFSPKTQSKLVSLNNKNFLFVKVGNPMEIFGMGIDYGVRWTYSAARSRLWMEVRDWLHSKDSGETGTGTAAVPENP